MKHLVWLAIVAACGGARGGRATEAPRDPDLLAIAHAWLIENHVVTPRSYLADADAMEMHGRTVAITANGYTTPFQGACKHATFSKQTRVLAQVAADEDLADDLRFVPERFGITGNLLEFKFVCNDVRENGRSALVPIRTIYVADARAMTCFAGVCYLLTRKP